MNSSEVNRMVHDLISGLDDMHMNLTETLDNSNYTVLNEIKPYIDSLRPKVYALLQKLSVSTNFEWSDIYKFTGIPNPIPHKQVV